MNKVKRVGCKNKEQVKDLICYIHHNAIHHGLSQDFGQWDFDFFSLFQVEKEKGFIARKEVIELLGNYASFQAVHNEYKSIHFEEKYHRINSSLEEI